MDESDRLDLVAFWEDFARAFAAPLATNGLLGQFTTNPAITGAYAEAWVRSLVRSMVQPFRVSTGAVIRTTDRLNKSQSVPQCDLIVWDPTELPAIFENGEFALVHTQAARGIIEVKRSISSVEKTREQLAAQQQRLLWECRKNVLCVVVSHPTPLISVEVTSDWLAKKEANDPPELTRLLDGDRRTADVDGVFSFVYFLSHVSRQLRPRTAG